MAIKPIGGESPDKYQKLTEYFSSNCMSTKLVVRTLYDRMDRSPQYSRTNSVIIRIKQQLKQLKFCSEDNKGTISNCNCSLTI